MMDVDAFDATKARLFALFQESVSQNTFQHFVSESRACLASITENDAKSLMELTVRGVLLELLAKKASPEVLEIVFQFSIDAAIQDICSGSLPVLVLSDMFDGSTLSQCETIFAFVESRVEIFIKDIFFKTCKNHLLRSCNDLLRRLSRSQNTVFCGRILLFLARIFPLSERSGLNIISEFNFDNTTIFSAKDDATSESDKDDTMEEGEIAVRPIAADYALYRKFWSLQEYFRNPTICYNKMHWRHFTNYASDILTVFGSFKSDDANSSKWKQTEVSSSDGTFAYFAKYLTSQKLLELELSDSNFRRYLLIQFLILFQYLSSPVKFKLETYVLTDEQQCWMKETTARVYKLLEETPPDGPVFSKNIAKILKREEYWNAWKNEGCPDFKSVEEKAKLKPTKHKRRLGDDMEQANKVFVGNSELTKLWNICPNNWEACKSPKRKFVPPLEKFFKNAIEQAEPANEIENRYKDVYDPKFAWKSLRLLCLKSPLFFTVSNAQHKNLPEYLESVIQKIPTQASNDVAGGENETTSAEETLEDGAEEMLQPSEEETKEEVEKPRKPAVLNKSHIEALCSSDEILNNWKTLAKYLDFKDDEIAYFDDTYPALREKVERMLNVWQEQDPLGGSEASFLHAVTSSGLHVNASTLTCTLSS